MKFINKHWNNLGNKRSFWFLLGLWGIVLFNLIPLSSLSQAKSRDISVEEAIIKVQANYENLVDLEADFKQLAYNHTFGQTQEATGKIYILKPGKMLWDYKNPDKQKFIINEGIMWWYIPDEKQVIKQDLSQAFETNVPIAFMMGIGKLKESFDVVSFDPNYDKESKLTLKPKVEQVNLRQLMLVVDKKTFQLKEFVITDAYENKTTIILSNIKETHLNKPPRLSATKFDFKPPSDVEIISPEDFPSNKTNNNDQKLSN